MYKKTYWLLGLAFLCSEQAISQADIGRRKQSFSPASPEAASLFKFADMPVSKYTGTADVTIPLVTASGKNMAWPINLKYHTSGIKVAEMASYTGLGWQLNATGMVSRKVRGIADDDANGYLNKANWWQNVYVPLTGADTYAAGFIDASGNMLSGILDGEPDDFYFSFNGYSGKLAFKQGILVGSGKPELVVSCNVPMKVEYQLDAGKINAWIFTAPDGLKYTFDQKEKTSIRPATPDFCNLYSLRDQYTSSWYLSSIISVTGFYTADISFTYEDYGVEYGWQVTETETHSSATSSGCNMTLPLLNPAHSFSRSLMSLAGKKIKQIFFADSKTYVDFIYETARQDINNTALDYVVVSKLTGNGPERKDIEKVRLRYFHQGNRLMLRSVQQIDVNGTDIIPAHEFAYNHTELPDRVNGATWTDHWGYSSQGGLPTWDELHVPNWSYYGSAKTPNLDLTKSQSLTKISYPTGGSTSFNYELNSYGFLQDYPVNTFERFYLNNEMVSGGVAADPNVNGYSYNERRVYVGPNLGPRGYLFTISASLAPCYFEPAPDGSIPDGAPLFCPNRDFPEASLFRELPSGALEFVTTAIANYARPYLEVPNLNILPGYYVIKTKAASFTHPQFGRGGAAITASIMWQGATGALVVDQPAGGLRIRAITDYDPVAKISKTRRFDYTWPNGNNTYSSGVIYNEPKYLYTSKRQSSGNFGYNLCDDVTITAVNSVQSEQTNGSHIGYRRVTEWEEYQGRPFGKTVTNYTSPSEFPDIINEDKPFGIPLTNSFKTGLVTSEIVYDSSGQQVKKSDYEYVFTEQDIPSAKAGKGIVDCGCSGVEGPPVSPCGTPTAPMDINNDGMNDRFSRNTHPARMGFAQLKKETHLQDGFTIQKSYLYDNKLQLVKRIVVKNDNADPDSIVMTYKHPGDEADMPGLDTAELQAINSLKNFNMKTVVLEELKQRRTTDIIRIRNHFRNYQPQEFLQPAQSGLSIQNGSGSLERKYDIGHYNFFGQVVQQRDKNDAPETYIWDELDGQPSAKATNADINAIAFTSFESGLNGSSGWAVGSDGIYPRSSTNALTGKYAYQITNGAITKNIIPAGQKYVVSYWSKNGSFNVNGITPVTGRTNALGWTYYEHITSNSTTSITVSGTGLIDELRLYPIDAMMTSYSYEPGVGLRSQNTPDNIITFYEYDGFKRLKVIRDQDGNILQLTEYKYQQLERNVTPNWVDVSPVEERCETAADLGLSLNGNTGYRVRKQKDTNPFSSTYNVFKWIRVGSQPNYTACPVLPDWQPFLNDIQCVMDVCNNKSGFYRKLEKDMNIFSPTYNQTRWSEQTYPSNNDICAAPPPCDMSAGFRRINGVCTQGTKIVVGVSPIRNCRRTETYYFTWSCGARSPNYSREYTVPGCRGDGPEP